MIKIVTDLPPFPFEEIVKEVCSEPLAAQGFDWKPPAPSWWKNITVDFQRERCGKLEQLWTGRRGYNEEVLGAYDDEVDIPARNSFGLTYPSRHLLYVNLVSYGGNATLQTDGSRYQQNNDYFYFADEKDLRVVLHEKVLPLLLTVGLQHLDDCLEDAQNERASKAA